MARPRPEVLAVLVIYVLPLTAALVFLVSVGLYLLAGALLVIELAVLTAVVIAKRGSDH